MKKKTTNKINLQTHKKGTCKFNSSTGLPISDWREETLTINKMKIPKLVKIEDKVCYSKGFIWWFGAFNLALTPFAIYYSIKIHNLAMICIANIK